MGIKDLIEIHKKYHNEKCCYCNCTFSSIKKILEKGVVILGNNKYSCFTCYSNHQKTVDKIVK